MQDKMLGHQRNRQLLVLCFYGLQYCPMITNGVQAGFDKVFITAHGFIPHEMDHQLEVFHDTDYVLVVLVVENRLVKGIVQPEL